MALGCAITIVLLFVFSSCQEKEKKKEEPVKKEVKAPIGDMVSIDKEGMAVVITDNSKYPALFKDTLAKYNLCGIASVSIDGKEVIKNIDSALTKEINDWTKAEKENIAIRSTEEKKCDSVYKAERKNAEETHTREKAAEQARHDARIKFIRNNVPNTADQTTQIKDENKTNSANNTAIDKKETEAQAAALVKKKKCTDDIAGNSKLTKPKKLEIKCAESKICTGKKCELAEIHKSTINNTSGKDVKINFNVDVSTIGKLSKGSSYFCTCGLKL